MGDDPRALWKPILSDVFALHPWHMGCLTPREYEALGDYIKRMNEAHGDR